MLHARFGVVAIIMCSSIIAVPAQGVHAAGTGETAPVKSTLSADFETLLINVENADFSSAIGGVASSMHFAVVPISDLDAGKAERLSRALAARSEELRRMRAVLSAHDRATRALEAAGASVDQVVWLAGEGEYMMHLYAVDR